MAGAPVTGDESRGILRCHQHPPIDAMHIGVRSDIVRVGTRDERYCVFIHTHISSVQCPHHDVISLSTPPYRNIL